MVVRAAGSAILTRATARSAGAGAAGRRTRSGHLEAGSATGSVPDLGPRSSSRRPCIRRLAPGCQRSTITIEYRWADGRNEHLADIAADFVRRKVDVIVTSATPPTVAAKQATSVIPIVFAAVGDPVGSGVVKSLVRLGGNATGLSLQATDAVGKRLQLLGEVITGLRRLAIMANSGNPSAALEMREAEDTARTLGLEGVTSAVDPKTSRLRSMPLKAAWRPFTSATTHSRRYTRCPQFYYFISRAGGQMGLIAAYGCTMWWSASATLAGKTRSTFGASAVVRYAQAGAER